MNILTLNAGSGSLRCTLFVVPRGPLPREPLAAAWEGRLDSTVPGQPKGKMYLTVETPEGVKHAGTLPLASSHEERVRALVTLLWQGTSGPGRPRKPADIDVVGHRVVHGGDMFDRAARITPAVERTIGKLAGIAPLHNPTNLAVIRAAKKIFGPRTPQFAVFDTAFHRTLGPAASTYAGPYAWVQRGIRKYGFHGSSFKWASARAAHLLGRANDRALRLVICHLGGGCSICATRGGRSVDTTMGFTPLDGVAMCSRSGAVDPGILIYLLREGATAAELEHLLNKESGLKGLSGLPGDTRVILPRARRGHARAILARDVFIHRLRAGIAQMIASLGDAPHALVFTDAISEDEPEVIRAACAGFGFLDVRLDAAKNARSPLDTDLAARGSRVRVLLIQAREAWQIARECAEAAPPAKSNAR